MNLTVYPNKDAYFNIGLKYVLSLFKECGYSCENIIFLNLSTWSVKQLVVNDWVGCNMEERTVIISQPNLLPLANYFSGLRGNTCVVSLDNIKLTRKNAGDIANELSFKSFRRNSVTFTKKEYQILKNLLVNIPLGLEAFQLGVSTKTVYSLRRNVANKLSIRNIRDVLFW
jgi:DNA-binding CsgD family transcriptional regulator